MLCLGLPMNRNGSSVLAQPCTEVQTKRWSKFFATFFWVGSFNALLLWAGQAEIQYTLQEIPNLPEQGIFTGAMNNGGRAVGWYYWNNGIPHGFTYRDGVTNDLGAYIFIHAINNHGEMIGSIYDIDYLGPGGTYPGFLRDPTGKVTIMDVRDIVPPLNGYYANPEAINDSGVAVGQLTFQLVTNYQNITTAFLYQNGHLSALGSFQGNVLYDAQTINNRGQILALFAKPSGDDGIVMISGGQMREIVLPPNLMKIRVHNFKMNDHGAFIVGYTTDTVGGYFLYSGGKFRDLGARRNYFNSINNSNQIVGDGDGGAIISEGMRTTILNNLIDPALGVNLQFATDINDSGQICAHGTNASGSPAGFILTPIRRCYRDR
jgi:probable HAF family extracellular repeat protein